MRTMPYIRTGIPQRSIPASDGHVREEKQMGIKDKTRKLLWGKSGNRCAMCRHVLCVDATREDDESIIGDECHIISKKENGPRYNPFYPTNKLDFYENLILLCRIHHKLIDDQYTKYTAEILKQIKENHGKWVSEQLDKNPKISPEMRIKRIPGNIPKYLHRIASGKEILNIVEGADTFSFDHDELSSDEEVKIIGEFLDIVKDWGDLGHDLDLGFRVETTYRLTNLIKELDEAGFGYLEQGKTDTCSRWTRKQLVDGHSQCDKKNKCRNI